MKSWLVVGLALTVLSCVSTTSTTRYIGDENSAGLPHGWGRLTVDGAVHTGEFRNGVAHGMGFRESKNGLRYQGEYQFGKRHGQGTLIFIDGWTYEGGWFNSEMHGRGVMSGPDGSGYDGEYRHGVMHGKGVWINKEEGTRYEGEWRNGEFMNGFMMVDEDVVEIREGELIWPVPEPGEEPPIFNAQEDKN